MVLFATTRHPLLSPWIRGQLALHGHSLNDPRMPLDDLVAAIHATLASAPVDALKSINEQLVVAAVQVDPERARRTWGLLPEHQVTTPAERAFGEGEQR